MSLGPEWDIFEQDGHKFTRLGSNEIWQCDLCGATKDTFCYSGLPDDSWAELCVGGKTFLEVAGHFRTCADACILSVMTS